MLRNDGDIVLRVDFRGSFLVVGVIAAAVVSGKKPQIVPAGAVQEINDRFGAQELIGKAHHR